MKTSDCFPSPGACGYPDPAYGTVGATGNLTKMASFDVNTPNQTYSNLDITGGIDVKASGTTFKNVRITATDGGSGSVAVNIADGVDGTLFEDCTILGKGGATVNLNDGTESAIFNHYGRPLTLMRVDFENFADDLEGPATIKDSYLVSNGLYPGAHVEDIYISDDTVSIDHSVLFNPADQTATVFADVNGGGGGPSDNHVSITNSLLAGAGYTLYPGGGSAVGTSTMNVSQNRFARCLSMPKFDQQSGGTACANGADTHGYWPYGGYYGVAAYDYCPPVPGQTWSSNVWDDDSSAIACP